MALTFYAGSGSAPCWKVWLALEHKRIPYELKMLSFQAGDLKKPDYLAVNPRGKVPAIVDGELALYESSAIAEYLDEKWPEPSLLPGGPAERARIRRTCCEVTFYLDAALERVFDETIFAGERGGDPDKLAAARTDLSAELDRFEGVVTDDYLLGPLSLADFTLFPSAALVRRVGGRFPHSGLDGLIGPRLAAWMQRIEAQPYYDRTYPPHWRQQ
jgi:glutathione S-transferase